MEYSSKNKNGQPDLEQGLSPELQELLRSADSSPEIMSWDRVVALVESAPPVRVPWYVTLFAGSQRQLRYAAAPLLIMLMVGGMWIMPAQSLNVGTTVIAELPQDWQYDSPQFIELNSVSRADFDALAVPQANFNLMLMPGSDSQQLVMALSGLNVEQAQAYYDGLAGKFPALAAVPHEYRTIEAKLHDNLLTEVSSRIGGQVNSMDDNQLKLLVFETLTESGYGNIRLDIKRSANGRVEIDIAADPLKQGSHSELSRQELDAAGLNSRTLGPDANKTLNNELNGVELP